MSEKSSQENKILGVESGDLEKVSEIILGMSRAELLELHERIQDRSKFVDHVSNTLGDAILKASDNESFQSSIAPVVASGVLKTARREPMEMGKAIAPALGPAIRGMVTLALENMNQRIDAHIQTNFSVQGFKWRMESKKTGVPLADIVMRETLDFRVDHVLLIHQNTGILLQEASQPDIGSKDPAVVSSMLTAVSDFVVDAFGAENSQDEAQTYKVGDLTAYVERIGDLALAAVVRGTVSSSLKQMLRERLESICVIFGEAAHNFDGDIEPFAATESMIKDCLIARAKKKETGPQKSSGKIYAGILILIICALSGWWFYQAQLNQQKVAHLAEFKQALKSLPGATLINFDTENGFSIHMLLDELAEDPKLLATQFGYSADNINWTLQPYLSLEDSIIEARIAHILQPPESVNYSMDQGVLFLNGSANHRWLDKAEKHAPLIFGLTPPDFSNIRNLSLERLASVEQKIENTPVYFEYALAELSPQGMTTVDLLRPKFDELQQLVTETGQKIQVYAEIDPLQFSIWPDKDMTRAQKRVELLSSLLKQPILLGEVKIIDAVPKQTSPYAKFRVEYLEQ